MLNDPSVDGSVRQAALMSLNEDAEMVQVVLADFGWIAATGSWLAATAAVFGASD